MCKRVNVFIPTYNAVACIEETLNSVLKQTYKDLEVWVVDDASSDGTQERLRKWANKDPRVNLILKEKNEGSVPYSWQSVFPRLRGEWTLYMSHDDLLSHDCIELLVEQAEGDVDCVIPTCVGFEKNPFLPEIEFNSFKKQGDVSRWVKPMSGRRAFDLMLNYDIPGFALWRTSLIRKIGMPIESFNSDECMQRIWALHCKKVGFCPNAFFYYHLDPNGITKGLKAYHYGSLLTYRRLMKVIMKHFIISSHSLRFTFQFLRSEIYLRRQYNKSIGQYSNDDNQKIIKILYPWK